MKFSVIVPAYNVEKYIEECINSLLRQEKRELFEMEVILVDDGSTDKTGKICDEYAEKYPDVVKVYHKNNEGLLLTRRYGFKKATGNYIINCDSDDFMEKAALSKLHNTIEKYNPDIVLYNLFKYNGIEKQFFSKDIFGEDNEKIVSKEEVCEVFMQGHSIVSMCSKCIKKECIDVNKDYSKYSHIRNGEDSLQSIEIFLNANKMTYLNEALYNYREMSGMTSKFDATYFEQFRLICEELEKCKDKWGVNGVEKLIQLKFFTSLGRAITQLRYAKGETFKFYVEYLKKIRIDETTQKYECAFYDCKNKLSLSYRLLIGLFYKKHFRTISMLLKTKNILSRKRG